MTRDGHGRVRHINQYSSRVRPREPTDNATTSHRDRYRENWPTVVESHRNTYYVNRRWQDAGHTGPEPNHGPRQREHRPTQEHRFQPHPAGTNSGPVVPDVFGRIRPRIYTVIRIVQAMHHTDQWILANPIRSMVTGIHRMMDNIRPPVPDEAIRNSFKQMGEDFLSAICLRMNLHLDDVRRKAIEELAAMGPISRSDKDTIYDQALHLLKRNFGRKITEKDINMYLPEAVSYIRWEPRPLRWPTTTTNNKVNNGGDVDRRTSPWIGLSTRHRQRDRERS